MWVYMSNWNLVGREVLILVWASRDDGVVREIDNTPKDAKDLC